MKAIGCIGKGFVGDSLCFAFEKHFKVETFDLLPEKSTTGSLTELVEKSEIIFLALPTPISLETQNCDYQIIREVLSELNEMRCPRILILKSSVAPGKTKEFQEQFPNLKIVFNPEFLTERNAREDFLGQTKIVLGGNREHTEIVAEYYQVVFPNATIHQTDTSSAEMMKFIINCFLASKVSFFNEMSQVCEKLGISYEGVRKLAILDERIGESHTRVPGWDGHKGAGGSCFPANQAIMKRRMEELGIKPTMITASIEKNLEVRPEKDWELLKGRCVE